MNKQMGSCLLLPELKITGHTAPDTGIGLAGEAESLDEAKAAFHRLIDWAARAEDGDLPWQVRPGQVVA